MTATQPVAVITGASQGIGEALVTRYHNLGYVVIANTRSIEASDDPSNLSGRGNSPGTGRQPKCWLVTSRG
jgi:NAD(P)-dependent dehydrogenase (short-subunit alcohol dehydrogenase family)